MERTKNIWQIHNPNWYDTIPSCSMYDYLYETAQEHLDLYAINFEGKKTTYRQFLKQIDDVAKALVFHGIKKDDVISIISVNTPQAILTMYAANKLGAISNMIHPLLSPTEIQSFVEKTGSSAILILDQIYPKIQKIEWRNNASPKIILTRIIDALPVHIKPLYKLSNKNKIILNPNHNTIYWNDFLSSCKENDVSLPTQKVQADDTAIIMYSGGTTGTPKGVMLSNLNFNSYIFQARDVSGVPYIRGKKSIAILPLFHGYGLATGIHSTLCSGVYVHLVPKFEFKRSVSLIFKKKINLIYAVPALFEALSRNPKIDKTDLSFFMSLVSGGDKLDDKLYKRLNEQLIKGNSGALFFDGYGQSECTSGCMTNPYFAINPASVGILHPDMLGKIVKPGTHIEVPIGEDGELCVCGPTVMKGYYNNEEATSAALQIHEDGRTWLHTGDMFSTDENGYFYFKQRLSRMAISAGYNIYVTQIEKLIATCPDVEQCCVVGIKDRAIGQKIRACVVSSSEDKQSVKTKIIELCKNNLAEYSQPHEIKFYERLPLTNLGKVDFKKLENEE